jgi:hypothetical protein
LQRIQQLSDHQQVLFCPVTKIKMKTCFLGILKITLMRNWDLFMWNEGIVWSVANLEKPNKLKGFSLGEGGVFVIM